VEVTSIVYSRRLGAVTVGIIDLSIVERESLGDHNEEIGLCSDRYGVGGKCGAGAGFHC
jgi:hypothetical protein